mgnify:CR=1 FL=1
MNPYQGCEHGCAYCYARPTHTYWGFNAGHDFESRIVVKRDAPALLRKKFNHPDWIPAPISLSGNTDCYQPAEKEFRLSRKILEVCLEYRNPIGIITKNALLLRDLDLLQELANRKLVSVFISITSDEENLRRKLEPRTSSYKNRFHALQQLACHGIPCGVMMAPVILGLNDHRMFEVLERAAHHGASFAGYTILRLNPPVDTIFTDWLHRHYPQRAEKILHYIEAMHGGQLSDHRYKIRFSGDGPIATIIQQQFTLYTRRLGLGKKKIEYDLSQFRRPYGKPLTLFGD